MHVYEAALKMDVTPLSVYIYGFMTRTYGSSRVCMWCAYSAQVQADPASKFGWPQCL